MKSRAWQRPPVCREIVVRSFDPVIAAKSTPAPVQAFVSIHIGDQAPCTERHSLTGKAALEVEQVVGRTTMTAPNMKNGVTVFLRPAPHEVEHQLARAEEEKFVMRASKVVLHYSIHLSEKATARQSAVAFDRAQMEMPIQVLLQSGVIIGRQKVLLRCADTLHGLVI